MCAHNVRCPSSDSERKYDARVVAWNPEAGWQLLCNGVLTGDDILETTAAFDRWRWVPPADAAIQEQTLLL